MQTHFDFFAKKLLLLNTIDKTEMMLNNTIFYFSLHYYKVPYCKAVQIHFTTTAQKSEFSVNQ